MRGPRGGPFGPKQFRVRGPRVRRGDVRAAILDLLYAEITRPEYTVRLRWEPGTVAFWDNRATAHLAPRDIEHLDLPRTLHRVTLVGDVPVLPPSGSIPPVPDPDRGRGDGARLGT